MIESALEVDNKTNEKCVRESQQGKGSIRSALFRISWFHFIVSIPETSSHDVQVQSENE